MDEKESGIARYLSLDCCLDYLRRLFTNMWSEPWFQDGMRAFGLLALEREKKIEILKSQDGELFVRCPDGKIIEITAFLDGESLPIRHDPEFSDLSWDPVSSMGHLLAHHDEDD